MVSKSILVIDTPSNCEQCPFVRHRIDCIPEDFCTLDKHKRDIINSDIKPDWCSLKEVPDKMKAEDYLDDDAEVFVDGYNSCIDDIVGKNEIC